MCCVKRESFGGGLPGQGFGGAGLGPQGVNHQGQKGGVFDGGFLYKKASNPNYTGYR